MLILTSTVSVLLIIIEYVPATRLTFIPAFPVLSVVLVYVWPLIVNVTVLFVRILPLASVNTASNLEAFFSILTRSLDMIVPSAFMTEITSVFGYKS